MLHCHLQPGASNDEITGIHGERLKIRVSAAPTGGKANDQLIRFLSREFGVGKASVQIQRGLTGRQKTVAIVAPRKLPPTAELFKGSLGSCD
ncbi:MAG: DUF167 family protein [Cellvibrionaceae bacterium]